MELSEAIKQYEDAALAEKPLAAIAALLVREDVRPHESEIIGRFIADYIKDDDAYNVGTLIRYAGVVLTKESLLRLMREIRRERAPDYHDLSFAWTTIGHLLSTDGKVAIIKPLLQKLTEREGQTDSAEDIVASTRYAALSDDDLVKVARHVAGSDDHEAATRATQP